jgi:hypothetical protein
MTAATVEVSPSRNWTKKASMNVNGFEKTEMNVVPLFGGLQEENIPDPLETLLQETEEILIEEKKLVRSDRPIVSETQFPDQSMFTLDQQLGALKESISRMKFYLLDLDDLLPK